jgi:hypothetical protein
VTCSLVDAPIALTDPGQYCWNVTVNETGDNYSPDSDGTFLGIDDLENECFTIPESYIVVTTSSTTGEIKGTVSNPTDTVTITGVEGVEGTFVTDAVLVDPDTVEHAASCTDSPVTIGNFDLIVTCALDTPTDFEDAGLYCWNVTVNETGDNYGPASDGTFLGIDDLENECFEILPTQGCTPGYWKQPQHFGNYEVVTPSTTLKDAGFIPDNGTDDQDDLVQALKYQGDKGEEGAERILLRAAVAGLLNIYKLDNYAEDDPVTFLAAVNAAMDSNDRQTMLDLAADIDADNNGPEDFEGDFCPLGKNPLEQQPKQNNGNKNK